MGKLSFYHDEPLFGLDIGNSSLKVMELQTGHGGKPRVIGYGVSNFYSSEVFSNGVINNSEVLADALYEVLKKQLVGSISTSRVACTLPTSHSFSRPMRLPPMEEADIAEAVHLEVEQYVPMPIDNLYIDYEISRRDTEATELLMVAIPRKIVDSYVSFLESLGLEPVAMEPTMNATSRLFSTSDPSHSQASILVDFGSVAIDVAAFDQTMFVNSTLAGGSDTLTNLIADRLSILPGEAYALKNRYGITSGDKKDDILGVAKPMLDNLVREIEKILRYYNERGANKKQRPITQIITMGGGAILPGLSEYLTTELKIPTRTLDPWHSLDFGLLKPPSEVERSMFLTVAGEALLNPKEIFA